MHISYRWLGRHVDLTGLTPEDVVLDLTLSTAEVEGLERFCPALDAVVVGHVVQREPHPDADKLSVCLVDVGAASPDGSGAPLQIVCGAPNVRQGLKVAVARVGTVLPGDFKIKKSKIRGVESVGMICSERELGLGDEHDGIWELPDDAPTGEPVSTGVGIDDWVIEIDNKSLTHRPDLWGHRGLAGELAAIRRRPLLPLDTTLPDTGSAPGVPVAIESEACSRYLALAIDGVAPVRSPEWLRHLLLAVGQRPLDLLVDVSNFVMLDLGQPNHLFDRAQLGSEGIVVRDAREGETLTTLDGEERVLSSTDLLICNGARPVALAGVMGGEESKVAADTQGLLLEVATFAPAVVRRTAARLGLRTDSSARFEKHLDPTLPLLAAGHLVRTLASIQPELRLPGALTDAGSWTDPACEVALRPERVRAVLGKELADDEIAEILAALGFGLEREGATWTVRVPSARATKDVGIEEDLIEEVGRIHRYGNLPEYALVGPLVRAPRDPMHDFRRRAEDRLAGDARFHESMSHTFQSDGLLAKLGLEDLPYVTVQYPVAEDLARVRRSVAPSLLGVLENNLRHRAEVRLFETGKGYLPEEPDERDLPREVTELAIALAAPLPTGDAARFDGGAWPRLKSVVDDLVHHLEREPLDWQRPAPGSLPAWAHPARAAAGVGRVPAQGGQPTVPAQLLTLGPAAARALGVAADVAVAVIDLGLLLAEPERDTRFVPIPRFEGLKLDVALALGEAVTADEVRAAIERSGKGLVAEAELFDLYSGPQVGEGKKSLAWHVLLQSPTKTLTDKEGQKFLGRLEREVESLGGVLRKD